MKMAAAVDSFQHWLGNKLKDLKTDENVFGSYIIGILDSDDTAEEKTEALQGILSEIVETENDITRIYNEIMEMWLRFKPRESPPGSQEIDDVDVKLAKLLESQCLSTTKQKEYTEEEKKIREAILSQYSQMSDEDGEGVEVHATSSEHKENGRMEKNTNALSVQQAEKEKREQAKMESLKKKEKDKEDREKQKQMREEKKEKRKTQKGERRR